MHPVTLASFGGLQKDIHSGHNKKPDWLYALVATKKKDIVTKRLCTWLTFSQSLMASVSK